MRSSNRPVGLAAGLAANMSLEHLLEGAQRRGFVSFETTDNLMTSHRRLAILLTPLASPWVIKQRQTPLAPVASGWATSR